MFVIVMAAPPLLVNVTLVAPLVVPVGTAPKLTVAGGNVAAATGVSAGAVNGADGPPTTPEPFSKMVCSVSASGARPSQIPRDSAPMNTTPVVVVPPTARTMSVEVRPV